MSQGPGLYIHFPFCTRRCPYCDFYSISALELIDRYVQALALEARQAAPKWREPFETLYIGGGSPSLLNREGLEALLKALEPLDLSQLQEITLEANPEDVSGQQALLWAEKGVTRLSLGLQTLDGRWLADVLGRVHSLDQSRRAVELLSGQSYALSFDLIYALPAQEPRDWVADLTRAAKLGPAHISTYSLTVEAATPLARSIAERLVPPPPPADAAAEFFLLSAEALAPLGFYRYEVSNFARPGHECRHNLKYWRRQPYLGLGPAAHSFDGQRRWANVASVRRWASALGSGSEPLDFCESIDERAAELESLMLGLRLTEGLPAASVPPSAKLDEYLASGHLTASEGRLRPTEKGLLIADRLALDLSSAASA